MDNYTGKLVAFADELTFEKLPKEVIEQTKKFIADYYAASFAGYKINKQFNDAVFDTLMQLNSSNHSSVLLSDKKFSVSDAAFMNTVYAHGADMDDGNKKSAGHIGAHVISTAFAMAEYLNLSWREVFTAINIGYDFFNRIGGAAQPSLYNKGFHSTGVAGAVSCAAVAAKLLKLDYEGIYNAVSLAAVQSSGLIVIDESGQGCKPINPANAARTGIISALIASKGIKSPDNPLESKKGWFNAFSDSINEDILLDGLGKTFTINESYLKLYSTCRHTHSCIDAAKEILKNGINANDIEKVSIEIYPSAIKSAGKIVFPETSDEAKFSVSYAVAVTLSNGTFTLGDIENVNKSERVINLSKKVELIPNEKTEDRAKGIRGCKLTVKTVNGKEYTAVVDLPKGEGKNTLSWQDINEKMHICAKDVLSDKKAEDLTNAVKNLDTDKKFIPLI